VEDNYLYSINYVHTGHAKRWYGVPGSAAEQFEQTMRKELPELFERNPNLLHLLVTQLSPRYLIAAGVPVYTALQQSGQFVITCPRAYHAGFNTGFNCAESVNFALEDWLPFCKKACNNYRFQRSAVFPFEEFVIKAAENPDSTEIAIMLQKELQEIIVTEEDQRKNVFEKHGIAEWTPTPDQTNAHQLFLQNYQPCRVCGYDCYISGIICLKHTGYIACLQHASELCNCAREKRLAVRKTLPELKEVLRSIPTKFTVEPGRC